MLGTNIAFPAITYEDECVQLHLALLAGTGRGLDHCCPVEVRVTRLSW